MMTALGAAPIPIGQLQRTLQLRERIAEACRLVSADRVIRSVHIVAKGCPTSEEQQLYRDYAARYHVNLSVDSHGMISVRPQALEEA